MGLALQVQNNTLNLVVRRLEVDDIKALKKIYSEAFEIKTSSVINYTKEDIYVVCVNDKVVGMCMTNYIDDIFISSRVAYVNSVCVDKKYRKQGVATFMLNEIEKIALEDGCTEIMLTSTSKREAANHLYSKLGFSVYDTNVFKKKIV